MISDELKMLCKNACIYEFNNIYKKYGNEFSNEEPFVEVEQEELDEAKNGFNKIRKNWGYTKENIMKDVSKKILCTQLEYLKEDIIHTMCELAQSYAVLERYIK